MFNLFISGIPAGNDYHTGCKIDKAYTGRKGSKIFGFQRRFSGLSPTKKKKSQPPL